MSVKFPEFFGSHRRPIGTPTDLAKLVSNQRVRSVWRFGEGSMLEADSHYGRFWHKAAVSWRAGAPVALSFDSPYHLPGFSAKLPDLDAFTAGFW